jgi:hypothetical protein
MLGLLKEGEPVRGKQGRRLGLSLTMGCGPCLLGLASHNSYNLFVSIFSLISMFFSLNKRSKGSFLAYLLVANTLEPCTVLLCKHHE